MRDFPIYYFSETHFHVCFSLSFFLFYIIILSSLISWKTASPQRNAILVRVLVNCPDYSVSIAPDAT